MHIMALALSPEKQPVGICVWFTGLSGSGKSTTAFALAEKLQEEGNIVTVLDGDETRQHLSSELGFSKKDRETNVSRIGYVASLIVKHGGIVICSAISPYQASRNQVRAMFEPQSFLETYMATPLEVCEARDTKGLYRKARAGEIATFTGISDPYEPPQHPDICLETVDYSLEENIDRLAQIIHERRGME